MSKRWSIALVVVFAIPLIRATAQEAPAPEKKPFDQTAALEELRTAIKGREEAPASEVFKNLKVLDKVPAGRLLKIMEHGWGGSLGVTCDHCHVPGKWESDDVPGKEIARDMAKMTRRINQELLAEIEGLKSNPEKPAISCATCHRGQVRPATSMPK